MKSNTLNISSIRKHNKDTSRNVSRASFNLSAESHHSVRSHRSHRSNESLGAMSNASNCSRRSRAPQQQQRGSLKKGSIKGVKIE